MKKATFARLNKKRRLRKTRHIVKKEIMRLFDFARQVAPYDVDLAREIIITARRMAMKVRLPLPRELRRRFCRKCNTPYTTHTVRIRIGVHHPRITYSCRVCGYVKRIPYQPNSKKLSDKP